MNRRLPRSSRNLSRKLLRIIPTALMLMLAALIFADHSSFAGKAEANKRRTEINERSADANGSSTKTVKQTPSANSVSDSDPWQTIDEKTLAGKISDPRAEQLSRPRAYRTVKLNRNQFDQIRAAAPKEFTAAARSTPSFLSLPLPDGSNQVFQIVDSPIMEPKLAARFPEIKTYSAQSTTAATVTARFDWTSFGFHAIILAPNGIILIEPFVQGDTENYISYFQKDMPAGAFECDISEAEQNAAANLYKQSTGLAPTVTSGATLRTYRLAVGVTAEYTNFYGGGTVSGALSAVTTTVNLVNAIYERDIAVRFVLIGNETDIIYTNTATDGYTSDNVNALISENQTKLDAVIGSANYDLGHVYDGRSNGGGFSFQGLGSFGVACRSGVKARGVSITRSVSPSSIIAYYSNAHEIGHQFNATHTFNAGNGNCAGQRASATAYEPGTGTTIMGYRFNCAPEDFMSQDTFFHVASLEQMVTYSTVGLGGGCPVATATGNGIPVIDAGPSYTIPRSTPFMLTATAGDPDNDPLTYSWEQFDLGAAAPPDTDDGSRPIFRVFAPVTTPTRLFPRLADVLSGLATFGESLPTTTRTLNFRVVTRDNRSGGGAIASAGTALNVRADSGPFTVTQPAAGAGWTTNSSRTVNWSVANTDQAPVSCASVNISLSTDGGSTFPSILANNTPNDGSETVTIPGGASSSARIRVAANGNIFFNISAGFTITGSSSTFPTITNFTPASGIPGTMVTITGTNFISPSAVTFNGTPAVFTVNSTTEIVATVPSGATSGFIAVTTPSGQALSPSTFIVTLPTMQFNAANYSVDENANFATITVTRTGDTSGSSSIDFETGDDTARQRTDYSIAAGTVTFAAGETSKTFRVLVVDDAYVEGSETLNLSLFNPVGGTFGSVTAAVLTIADNDAPATNPLDVARFFVQQHYYDFLTRFPDSGGWDFWTDTITACGADQACTNTKRIDVSNAFYYEQEFQQSGSYVYRLYRAAYGNNQPFPNPNPDPANPGEEKKVPLYLPFIKDRARVRGGSQLAQFQLALANAFVQRAEFTNKYATGLSGPEFVDAILASINNDLGVNLTSQRQALIDLFNVGGRGNVVYRLADDNLQTNPINNRAFIDAEYNRAFVFTQYAGYLRRNADMAGFLFWLGQVNGAPIRDVPKQHAMVCSFITSAEYQQRFSSVVSHNNTECQ
jgi:Metallo-peptidase family M12B Reprolysin-like/Calx-beta domain